MRQRRFHATLVELHRSVKSDFQESKQVIHDLQEGLEREKTKNEELRTLMGEQEAQVGIVSRIIIFISIDNC